MLSLAHLLTHLLLVALASAAALTSLAPEGGAPRLAIRQAIPSAVDAVAVGTMLNEAQACLQYSRIANLSVIGANSTYRTTFLQASPVGTLSNAALLNKAIGDNALLMMDVALNAACGNLSTLAVAAAEANFTMGVVGQFTFVGNPGAIETGPVILACTLTALFIFGTLTAL